MDFFGLWKDTPDGVSFHKPFRISIAAVDSVRTKAKPKKRMAALRAAFLFLGHTLGDSYTF